MPNALPRQPRHKLHFGHKRIIDKTPHTSHHHFKFQTFKLRKANHSFSEAPPLPPSRDTVQAGRRGPGFRLGQTPAFRGGRFGERGVLGSVGSGCTVIEWPRNCLAAYTHDVSRVCRDPSKVDTPLHMRPTKGPIQKQNWWQGRGYPAAPGRVAGFRQTTRGPPPCFALREPDPAHRGCRMGVSRAAARGV